MKEKAFIGLFTNLFEYPTTTLLDKTVACQNIMEKESPESSKQLGIFLNYLFDTPFYELDLAFTRSPHSHVNKELYQCHEKFRHGMISSLKGELSDDASNQQKEDFYRFIRSLPSLSAEKEMNYVINNFVLPVLQIIRNQFVKNQLIENNKSQHCEKDIRNLYMYKHAFDALYKALSERTNYIDSEESMVNTFSINPLITTQSQQVAASSPFMSKN